MRDYVSDILTQFSKLQALFLGLRGVNEYQKKLAAKQVMKISQNGIDEGRFDNFSPSHPENISVENDF